MVENILFIQGVGWSLPTDLSVGGESAFMSIYFVTVENSLQTCINYLDFTHQVNVSKLNIPLILTN